MSEPRISLPPLDEVAPPASRRLHAARAAVPPLADDRQGFRAVIARADFRKLWTAQAASQLADKFLMFTLLIVVYDLSRKASIQSLLMIAYTLPSVFLSAPAGVIADRYDKRTLMIATNVIRSALVLIIPLVEVLPVVGHQAWPLILITFLFSGVGQVFAPAEAASIPSLVTREQIMGATSLFMTTVILTLVLGVPAATLAIRLVGETAPFYIAAALFALAALAIWRIASPLRASRAPTAQAASLRSELQEGVRLIAGSPAIRLGLYQLAIALVVVFTVFALGPVFMVHELHRSDQDTYLVLIPATLGLVTMAAVLAQRGGNALSKATMLVAALTVAGASLGAVGVAPRLLDGLGARAAVVPVVLVLSGVFGCALGGLLIPAFTVLQERTDEETRGRIFGSIFAVINAAVAIPLLVAGVIADVVGVASVVAGLGVIIVIGAVVTRLAYWGQLAVLDGRTPPAPTAD
ncbi:MAG: MFS transporter [Candidatus Dormibacteraeota bacterium]|uniref:MFS transporter n=1 Tax=Candidatus Amunia macphersoniae TaxID=3127014 RepID=A0A934KS85_9BACT|nr:MFS transporter [Candidatus Dormibacteraeota bacterium]